MKIKILPTLPAVAARLAGLLFFCPTTLRYFVQITSNSPVIAERHRSRLSVPLSAMELNRLLQKGDFVLQPRNAIIESEFRVSTFQVLCTELKRT